MSHTLVIHSSQKPNPNAPKATGRPGEKLNSPVPRDPDLERRRIMLHLPSAPKRHPNKKKCTYVRKTATIRKFGAQNPEESRQQFRSETTDCQDTSNALTCFANLPSYPLRTHNIFCYWMYLSNVSVISFTMGYFFSIIVFGLIVMNF